MMGVVLSLCIASHVTFGGLAAAGSTPKVIRRAEEKVNLGTLEQLTHPTEAHRA